MNAHILIRTLVLKTFLTVLLLLFTASVVHSQKYSTSSLKEAIVQMDHALIAKHVRKGVPVDFYVHPGSIPYYVQLLIDKKYEIVDIFIRNGLDINEEFDNTTVLIYASSKGYLDMTFYLLDHGAEINAKNLANWQSLHFAAKNGYVELVKKLIEKGADINSMATTTEGSFTPLMLAANNGSMEVCCLLIVADAIIDIKNDKQTGAIELAKQKSRYWAIEVLSHPDRLNEIRLAHAINNRKKEEALCLLGLGASPDFQMTYGWNSFHIAAKNGQNEVLKELIKVSDKLDVQMDDGKTPLMLAVINNHFETVALLLENKASAIVRNKEGENAVDMAGKNGFEDIKLLFYAPLKAKKQYQLNRDLWQETKKRSPDFDEVQTLIDSGANPNTYNGEFYNALGYAVRENHFKITELFLDLECNPNLWLGYRGNDRFTPLMIAAYNGYLECANLLIEKGADTSLRNGRSKGAFEFAVDGKKLYIQQFLQDYTLIHTFRLLENIRDEDTDEVFSLLEEDIQIEYTDSLKNTALHYAAMQKDAEILKLILEQKPDLNKLNKKAESPALLAIQLNNPNALQQLLSAGADVPATQNHLSLVALLKTPEYELIQELLSQSPYAERKLSFYNAIQSTNKGAIESFNTKGEHNNMVFPSGLTPLQYAIRNADTSLMHMLLLNAADPDKIGSDSSFSPLQMAASKNDLYALRTLLEKGADSSIYTSSSLDLYAIAKENKAFHIQRYLRKGEAYYETFKIQSAFWNAIALGDLVLMKKMLQSGASLSEFSKDGLNAFHLSINYKQHHIFDFLVSSGANINKQTLIKKRTPIILAVLADDTLSCKKLLYMGADYEIKDYIGFDFSYLTILSDDIEIIFRDFLLYRINDLSTQVLFVVSADDDIESLRRCLANGIDINKTDTSGWTALHYAADNGHHKIVEYLLYQGASTASRLTKSAETPLMLAARKGHFDVCRILFPYSDTTKTNFSGQNAIEIAMSNEQFLIAQLFKDYSKTSDQYDFIQAVKDNDEAVVKSWLEKGMDPSLQLANHFKWSPLHYACNNGHTELVKLLLKYHAETNSFSETSIGGYTPLMFAVNLSNFQTSLLLLEAGANPRLKNDKGESAVSLANKRGWKFMKLLFKDTEKAIEEYQVQKALVDAAINKDLIQLKLILEKDINVNQKDEFGWTALHYAARDNLVEFATELMKQGADINARKVDGYTPLMLAAHNASLDMLKLLIEHGADIRPKNKEGKTALDIARKNENGYAEAFLTGNNTLLNISDFHEFVSQSDIEQANALYQEDPELINARNQSGYTALHYASALGGTEITDWLINKGADVNAVADTGWTPLIVAALNNMIGTSYLLLKSSADINFEDSDGNSASDYAVERGFTTLSQLYNYPDSIYYHHVFLQSCEAYSIDEEDDKEERAAVLQALRQADNVNFKNDYGWNALFIATRKNNLDLCKLLIQKAIDVNASANITFDKQVVNGSPLLVAAYNDFLEVYHLLNKHTDPELYAKNLLMVEQLIENGSNYWVRRYLHDQEEALTQYGFSKKMKLAIDQNNNIAVQELIVEGADLISPVHNTQTSLIYTIYKSNNDLLDLMIKNSPSLDAFCKFTDGQFTALMLAARRNNLEATVKLFRAGADPNIKNPNQLSALDYAREQDNADIVSFFENPEQFVLDYSLYEAIKDNNWEDINRLYHQGASLDAIINDEAIIFTAIYYAANDELKKIFSLPFDRHVVDRHGCSVMKDFIKQNSYGNQNTFDISSYQLFSELFEHLIINTTPDSVIQAVTSYCRKNSLIWYIEYIQDAVSAIQILKEMDAVLNHFNQKNTEEVIAAFKAKPELLSYRGSNEVSWLKYSIEKDLPEVFSYLVKNNTGHEVDNDNRTAFMRLLENKQYDLLQLMIDQGYDINYRKSQGSYYSETSLSNAVRKSDYHAVEVILNAGANPNLQSGFSNRPPIRYAVQNEDYRMTKMLLEQNASPDIPDKYGGLPIIESVKNEIDSIFYLLLDYNPDPNLTDDGWTALHYAARNDDTTYLKTLLLNGAKADIVVDINGKEYTPLMLAAYNENYSIIRILLAHGADPNFRNSIGTSAISLARDYKLETILRLFLEPEKGMLDFRLLDAVINNDSSLVHKLMQKNANVQQAAKSQKGLLHIATDYNSIQALKVLLTSAEIDINNQDEDGNTPLHLSIRKNKTKITEFLLAADANVNLFNNEGESPLHLAISGYKPEIIYKLLNYNANVYLTNQAGINAVEFAKAKGYKYIYTVLENPDYLTDITTAEEIYNDLLIGRYRDYNTLRGLHEQINKEFEKESDEYISYTLEYTALMAISGFGIKAYHLSEEILSLSETVYGKKTEDYIYSLEIYKILCKHLGLYEKELRLAKEIVELTADLHYKYSDEYNERLLGLAEAYSNNDMDSIAIVTYNLILEKTDPQSDQYLYLSAMESKAHLILYEKDTSTYLAIINEIFDFVERYTLTKDNVDFYVRTASDYGDYLFDVGKNEEGLKAYMQIISLIDTSELVSEINAEQRYLEFAVQLDKLGKYKDAAHYFDKVEYILRENHLDNGFLYTNYLMKRLAFQEKHDIQKAYEIMLELNTTVTEKLVLHFALLSDEEKYSYLETQESKLDAVYSFCFNHVDEFPELTAVAYNNQIKMKGILLDSRKTLFSAIPESDNVDAKAIYKEWQIANKELANLYTQSASERAVDLFFFENKIEKLEKELIAYATDISTLASIASYKTVQEKLGEKQAAIEVFHFNYKESHSKSSVYYCALVNSRQQEYPELIFLFNEEDLNQLIQKQNSESSSNYISNLYASRGASYSGNQTDYISTGGFYEKLWQPVDRVLQDVDEVFLSLSGITHKISYAALPVDSASKLIDHYNIHYVSSSRDIDHKKHQNISGRGAVLFGGINYNLDPALHAVIIDKNIVTEGRNNVAADGWSFLQGSLDEVSIIGKLLEEQKWNYKLLSGYHATEDSLKQWEEFPSVIHFATHGFFFPEPGSENDDEEGSKDKLFAEAKSKSLEEILHASENPLIRSGILLSSANYAWISGQTLPGKEDGILTAYEVSLLDLANTDLVVLSACETGLGEIRGSEGVFGLQRAFKLAGTKNIIMSLWQVPDKETAEFMVLFYSKLISTQNVGEAFRAAQMQMREKYDPYYWAGFVLIE